jgi:hypothetical protein
MEFGAHLLPLHWALSHLNRQIKGQSEQETGVKVVQFLPKQVIRKHQTKQPSISP